jgi:hypothetical protein
MALGSTQPLTEMSTRNLPESKCVRLISPPSMSRLSIKCGNLDVSQSDGPSRPVTGRALPFIGLTNNCYLLLYITTVINIHIYTCMSICTEEHFH